MNLNNIQIRETATSDFSHIMEVEKLAFGYDKEAELVAELLADNTTKPIVSLLAFIKTSLSDIFFLPEPISTNISSNR